MLAAAPTIVVDVGAWAATFLACLGLCAGLWKIPWIRKVWHRNVTEPRAEKQAEIVDRVVAPRFEAIQAELRTNGGASLRDAINRIELNVRQVDKRSQQNAERLERFGGPAR